MTRCSTRSWRRRSAPSSSPATWIRQERTSPSRAARRASARTSCRTSTSTRSCATAMRRRRSPICPGRRGTTRASATGPTCPRPRAHRLHPGRDQEAPAHLLLALLQDEPVQEIGGAERAQGRLGRLALAARRLAGAERFGGDRVDGRRRADSGRMTRRRQRRHRAAAIRPHSTGVALCWSSVIDAGPAFTSTRWFHSIARLSTLPSANTQ